MRFVVVTFGSDGDTRPFACLCRGLMDAGHEVLLLAEQSSLSIAQALGVPAEALAGDVKSTLPIVNPEQPLSMRDVLKTGRDMLSLIARNTQSWLEIIADRARSADAILFSGLAMCAGLGAALELHKPRLGLWLLPIAPTREFHSPMMRPMTLPGWANQLTYRLLHATLARYFGKPANAARQRLFGGAARDRMTLDCPILYGISSHLVARPADWPATHRICGHWSLPAPEWEAPQSLQAFLADGPPPIYVGFGSPSSFIRRKHLDVLVAAIAGRRALFYPGWSNIDASLLPKNFLVIGQTPHTWLFPRCSVIIHHGGAGTTHTSARAGVPSIVIPFGGDQLFWAGRLAAAGVAPKYQTTAKLNTPGLSAMLEFSQRDDVRQRAQQLGLAMSKEDGIRDTVRQIEELLAAQQSHPQAA